MYETVWPLGRSAYETAAPARGVTDLRGKTICQLWDFEFQGEVVYLVLREELSRRFPGVKFVDYNVFGNIHGAREAEIRANLPRMLGEQGCDAVIVGIGA